MPGPPQRIPRPPHAEPGGPAPWARLEPDRRRGISVDRVRQVVCALEPADVAADPGGRVAAAVLVPVFEDFGEARVVLTRRASTLRSHTGEVSFPGGRLDEGEGPLEAALREAAEEIGIRPEAVEIAGQLTPLATFSARSGITPFVGILRRRPSLTPNPAEVEHAFDVALTELLADGVFREERWSRPGRQNWPIYFFDLPSDIVWGATAKILHELLCLVTGVEAPPRRSPWA